MITGAESLLSDSLKLKELKNKKIAYLGHSASVDQKGRPILSALLNHKSIELSCLFSPQHGFHSTTQANMISAKNSFYKGLKLYSLYSKKNRRLTEKMKQSFDVLLFDLQDIGSRIYTYLTTLFYLIEDCEAEGKTLIVLDRPNPLGRYVEGSLLREEFKSFVGAGRLPICHGLTLGELALWHKSAKNLKTDLKVMRMEGYQPSKPWGKNQPWPLPSPNMTSLSCAQCYPGAVLLEGTKISEGRGTAKPFEIFGHPLMDAEKVKKRLREFSAGCFLREIKFEPAFDKWKGKICSGFQIHLEGPWAKKGVFRPYRLISLFLKAFHQIHPSISWKAKPPYEYEFKKDPIDIISAGKDLQNWIEDSSSSAKDWDEFLSSEERQWKKQQKDFLLYK